MTKRRSATRSRKLTPAQALRWLSPRSRRRRSLILLAAAVLLLAAMDRLGFGLYQGGDMGRYHQQWFFVTRVIDGDTLEIAAPDGQSPQTRVRLWGIDAPELSKPWQPLEAGEPGAEEARLWLTWRCEGRMVKLTLQRHRLRGVYGRVLAYISGRDGVCANEWLLQQGLVREDGRWWHPQRLRYETVQETARRSGIGLWQKNDG
ncbi:MAG: thermonuclease family protein [Phycisphaeraceae bacterium]|nr:thermonuclease family protein [Phycisphaeraceae bacterium]